MVVGMKADALVLLRWFEWRKPATLEKTKHKAALCGLLMELLCIDAHLNN